MRSAKDIARLYKERQDRLGPLFAQMREVRDTYNNDIVVPLPELSKHEQAAVANLTQQGLDQLARRTASVLPNQIFPALKPHIKASVDKAENRRKVTYGWHEQARIKKVLGRRSRWYFGYGCAPVVVRPCPEREGPKWEPVSPLDAFPSQVHLDDYTPADCIIRHKRTLGWLEEHYPDQIAGLSKRHDSGPDDQFEVLEYIDADQVSFVVLGKAEDYNAESVNERELTTLPNRAGKCWVVVPGRLTLDRMLGHFDGILGMHQTEAAMMAMQIIATRRGIMPREWLVANPGQVVSIIQAPDPATGTPGVLQGGSIQQQPIDPAFQALNVIDRLHATQREEASVPSEFGGFSQSDNVRTGRRAAQVMGAAIDFVLAEAQDAFAESLYHENCRAQAIDVGYFNTSKTISVSTKGAKGQVSYVPSELWETEQHIVEYPLAGTDLSDLVINGGQRVGMETMSKESFMEIDPLVNDVEAELLRLRLEKVENVFFSGALEQIADPMNGWSPVHFAEFARRLKQGESWEDAFTDLQKEIQEAQAQAAPVGAPETMPGMMAPGQGGEVPTIPEQGPSMQNLTSLLSSIGVADMAVKSR